MKKQFFLISQVFYPDEVSTAGLFTNLCERIAEKDVHVEVWCAQPSYNTKKKQKRNAHYNNINICYLPSTSFSKNNSIGRTLNYFTFSISLAVKLLLSKNKTTIFTSTNPPFLGFLVACLTSLRRRKFNYIVQDVFPDGLIKLNKLKAKGIGSRIWRTFNRFTLRKANTVIVIGRDMKDWVIHTHKPAYLKTCYIPIWQDGTLVKPLPLDKNKLIREHGLVGKFVIQYSGNMGLWNDMKTFGLAANELNNDYRFLFIGDGIRKQELVNSLSNQSIKNSTFLPFQPKEMLNQSLTACHVALVSLNKGLEGIAVPSKVMGIMAAGIPVIALVPEKSEIALLIQEFNFGFSIEPGDFRACSKAITELKENEALRKELGANARNAFVNQFSTKVISEEYIKLL